MREQHLSDEAVAAFADSALSRGATERARRHTAHCPECAYAVAVQREAVWALRAAPAPALPTGLLDRLRDVPTTTPLSGIPAAVDDSGRALFPAFGAAAFVAPRPSASPPARPTSGERSGQPAESRAHRLRPLAIGAAAVAAAGAVAGAVTGVVMSGDSTPPAAHPHIRNVVQTLDPSAVPFGPHGRQAERP